MPKSKHRKKKPQPARPQPPQVPGRGRDPDLGEFLWNSGHAGKEIVLVSALPVHYHEQGTSTDLYFIMHTPDGKLMGTLTTTQSAALLGTFLDGRSPVRIDGRLDAQPVRGNGGEQYRLLLGTVRKLDPAEAVDAEPTIGRVHPERVRRAEALAAECRDRVTGQPIAVVTGFNPPIDPAVIRFLSLVPEPDENGHIGMPFPADQAAEAGDDARAGKIDTDRLDRAESYARSLFGDDAHPLELGRNPPTDRRIISCLEMAGRGWPGGQRMMLGDTDITADLGILYDQLDRLNRPRDNEFQEEPDIDREAVRAVGVRLDRIGGIDAMRAAAEALRPMVGGKVSRLDWAWNGIGEWKW
jgi:hypothetical protein